MRSLQEIAQFLSRTREDTERVGDPASVRAKYALMGVVVTLVVAMLVPALIAEIRKTTTVAPTIRVDAGAWRVIYGRSPESCDEQVRDTAGCLANPANPELWNSRASRTDADHLKKLQTTQQSELWLGLTVPTGLLTSARKIGENQFVLGSISGSYRVWVDGELILDGSDSSQGVPAVIPVPLGRLEENRPLRIAVQILGDSRSPRPDVFGGSSGEGFTSLERTQYFIYHSLFWNDARPWSLALVHALLAALFLALWSSARKRQEYLYLAVYAMAHAGLDASHIDLVRHRLGYGLGSVLDSVFLVYDGAFALFAALAFARSRRSLFQWGVPLAVVAPLVLFALSREPLALFARARWIGMALLPAFYLAGAGACALQGWLVKVQARAIGAQARAKALENFALTFVLQAVLYFWEAHRMSLQSQPQMISGFGHALLALGICLVALPGHSRVAEAPAETQALRRAA